MAIFASLFIVAVFVLVLIPESSEASCSSTTTTTTDSCCNGGKFGESTSEGMLTFLVEAGGEVNCSVDCSNAGAFFYMKLDGIASDSNFDVDGAATCDGPSLFSYNTPVSTQSLSFYIYGDADSEYTIDCSCDRPGTVAPPAEPPLGPPKGTSGGCFSASSIVHVKDRGSIFMKNLQVGDKVLTGNGKEYQHVYSFGHYQESAEETFYQVYTTSSKSNTGSNNTHPLEMTGNHLVFAMDDQGQMAGTRADRLQIGDVLQRVGHYGDSELVQVYHISTLRKRGLYMPLTPGGTIIVEGILVSTYVSIQEESPKAVETTLVFPFLTTQQDILHWWLSPYRMFCMGVSSEFCSLPPHRNIEEEILPWLQFGRHLARVSETHGLWFRVLIIGIPTFLVLGSFRLSECLFLGPTLAPSLIVTIFLVSTLVGWYHTRCRPRKPSSAPKLRSRAVTFSPQTKGTGSGRRGGE